MASGSLLCKTGSPYPSSLYVKAEWSSTTNSDYNYSNVTVHLYIYHGGLNMRAGTDDCQVTIGNVTSKFTGRDVQTTSSPYWLGQTTIRVPHDDNGTATPTMSIVYKMGITYSGTYVGNITGSGTITLDTIPRASGINVSNGTLGTEQTITADRKASHYTHTLTWSSGSYSGTLCTKEANTTVWKFTPPLTLANNAPNGTSVQCKFKLETYNGNTLIGSAEKTVSMSIPASVKPSVSVNITEPSGQTHVSTYGGYIQGKSKLLVTLNVTKAYSSDISSYLSNVDGRNYTTASFTTDALTSSGTVTVSSTVTDGRSRTGSGSSSINVIPYSVPKITKLNVIRADQDGTENAMGSYAKVTFGYSVTELNGNNTVTPKLWYRKKGDTSWTRQTFTASSDYTVDSQSVIFAADNSYAYEIWFQVDDSLSAIYKVTNVSTGFCIMHFPTSGKGVTIGGIATKDNFSVKNMESYFEKQITSPEGSIVYSTSDGHGGNPGYLKIATFVIKGSYINEPIEFTISQRGYMRPTKCWLRFSNVQNTDPDLYSFCREGPNKGIYIRKSSTSTWDLYVYYNPYDRIAVTTFNIGQYAKNRLNVMWTDEFTTSTPSNLIRCEIGTTKRWTSSSSSYTWTFTTSQPVWLISSGSNHGGLLYGIVPLYTTSKTIDLLCESFTVEVKSTSNGVSTVKVTDTHADKNRTVHLKPMLENWIPE